MTITGLLAMATVANAQDDGDATETADQAPAPAPESRANAQADVWATIEAEWNLAAKGSTRWIDDYLADDFVGWGRNAPAPRNKLSTRMWTRFENTQGKVVAHELYPLSIVVRDDTAIAHYLYTSAFEDRDGNVEVSNGRYTDILVLEEDGWKFIAWHGGDD